MNLAVPLQRFSIVLAFALASFNNSCMQNIINLWDYTEVLHNLCFVSTSFLFSETFFFSFDCNMHGPNLAFFQCFSTVILSTVVLKGD